MRYVSCQMRWDADYTGQNCANLVGVNYANVNDCFIGELGKQLQLDAEEQTHLIAKPYPRFVPTIVFNRVSELVYYLDWTSYMVTMEVT